MAGEFRGDFGGNRCGRRNSLLFFAAVEDSHRLDATDIKRDRRPPEQHPPPNILQQIGEFIVLGRNYINVVSREEDQVLKLCQKKSSSFLLFRD